MQPTHQDLQPYCEIYHLVKTAPGAKILSLGTASGVYIGYVPIFHQSFLFQYDHRTYLLTPA